MKDLEHITKLHELLDLAVEDMQRFDNDPEWGWGLDVVWLSHSTCMACIAGAVMLYSLEADTGHEFPHAFPDHTGNLLNQLDELRWGKTPTRKHKDAIWALYKAALDRGYNPNLYGPETLSYFKSVQTYAKEHNI